MRAFLLLNTTTMDIDDILDAWDDFCEGNTEELKKRAQGGNPS